MSVSLGLIRGAYSGSPDFALNDISGAIFWSIERALNSKSLTFTMLSIFSYFVIGFASKKEYAIGAIFFYILHQNIYSETLFLIYITKKFHVFSR